MTNVLLLRNIVNKTRIINRYHFCFLKNIYRKKNNCRVAMITTYTHTSCNSENIVACIVGGEGLLHACISSI